MKIAPSPDVIAASAPRSLSVQTPPSEPFATLLDGAADGRIQDDNRSFGFAELGPFGRTPSNVSSLPAGRDPRPVRWHIPATALGSGLPCPAPQAAAPPEPPPALSGNVDAIPGDAMRAPRTPDPAIVPKDQRTAGPGISPLEGLVARSSDMEPQAPVETQRRARMDRADAAAPDGLVNVSIFERNGLLDVTAAAPRMSLELGARLRRLAEAAATEAGLKLGRISLNGAPLGDPLLPLNGAHDGNQSR